MLEEIHVSLVDLVLEAIRADRQGTTAVQTTIVSGVSGIKLITQLF